MEHTKNKAQSGARVESKAMCYRSIKIWQYSQTGTARAIVFPARQAISAAIDPIAKTLRT
jgi:hypothetical protein